MLRWSRAWGVVGALLVLLPLCLLLPAAQRLLFPVPFRADLLAASRTHGIDPCLLAAVVFHESAFRPEAVSDEGAVGLAQLMPGTARWAAEQSGTPWRGVGELRRPDLNLRLGAWYLGWLLRRFQGNSVLALAAYNGGQHAVDRWCASSSRLLGAGDLPYPETRRFVGQVLSTRDRYRTLYPDLASAPGEQ